VKTELQKLLYQYEKAAHALCSERDKLFPIGSKVRSKWTDLTATVIAGSLYPDQVNTTMGHNSPYSLEVINEN
jgi:hypothetical protein